jgi:hypothetical protein
MARLTFFAVHAPVAAAAAHPLPVVFLVVLVVAAVVVSLCTSSTHAKLWKQRGTTTAPLEKTGVAGNRKNMLAASLSGIGGKAARMVSWNRRSPSGGSSDDDEGAAVEDEDAVWRKAIIMGDKCRPIEFSGHIAFDSDGNQLPLVTAKKTAADVAQN